MTPGKGRGGSAVGSGHGDVQGGHATYGQILGILAFDGRFPRPPGDMGNAATFSFPVRYEVVAGVRGRRIIEGDPTILPNLLRAARALDRAGVKAITTTCGFYIMFQRKLAEAVSVPVFSSSLMQLPLVLGMLPAAQRVGVLTERAEDLTPRHFEEAGVDPKRLVCFGLESYADLQEFWCGTVLDEQRMGDALSARAVDLVTEHPDIGAILLECANYPPYAWRVQKATGRLVFDFTTFTAWVYAAACRRPFGASMATLMSVP